MAAELLTLSNDLQRLQVAPACGAAIARWEWNTALGTVPLLQAAALALRIVPAGSKWHQEAHHEI